MASIDISSGSDSDDALKLQNSQKRLRPTDFQDQTANPESEDVSEEDLFSSTSSESHPRQPLIENIIFLKREDYALVPQKIEDRFLKFYILSPYSFSIDAGKKYQLDLMFSVLYEPIMTTYIFHLTWYKPFYMQKSISMKEMTFDSSSQEDWLLFLENESDEKQHVNKYEVIGVMYLLNITVDRDVQLHFQAQLRAQE